MGGVERGKWWVGNCKEKYNVYPQSTKLSSTYYIFRAFDVNVQCVAELYNKTFEECREQYLDLYQMFFTTNNDFDPKNCKEQYIFSFFDFRFGQVFRYIINPTFVLYVVFFL